MNRLLLALLALISGLSAQASPAMARISASESAEVGSYDTDRGAQRAVATQAPESAEQSTGPDKHGREAARGRSSRAKVYIPAVQYGVDRAHE